jgi:ABC-type cobalamin/Fe3+-siderophores transport system ATPase subunit
MVPTPEQQFAIEKFRTGRPLKIAAFAGSGKTTTLKMLAEATPSSRGVYLAFNRAIAAEAKAKFPRSVDCRTTHAIAFRAVMPHYGSTAKMTTRLHPKQLSTVLDYVDRIFPGTFRLNGVHQGHVVLSTLRRYCQSSDATIGLQPAAIAHLLGEGRMEQRRRSPASAGDRGRADEGRSVPGY